MTNSMELEALAAMVVSWHRDRFPAAGPEHVALKAASEVGELCDEVCTVAMGAGSLTSSYEVGREAADVVICLLALLGRWYPDVDLLAEVRAKLAILRNPDSGHRSASFRVDL